MRDILIIVYCFCIVFLFNLAIRSFELPPHNDNFFWGLLVFVFGYILGHRSEDAVDRRQRISKSKKWI